MCGRAPAHDFVFAEHEKKMFFFVRLGCDILVVGINVLEFVNLIYSINLATHRIRAVAV